MTFKLSGSFTSISNQIWKFVKSYFNRSSTLTVTKVIHLQDYDHHSNGVNSYPQKYPFMVMDGGGNMYVWSNGSRNAGSSFNHVKIIKYDLGGKFVNTYVTESVFYASRQSGGNFANDRQPVGFYYDPINDYIFACVGVGKGFCATSTSSNYNMSSPPTNSFYLYETDTGSLSLYPDNDKDSHFNIKGEYAFFRTKNYVSGGATAPNMNIPLCIYNLNSLGVTAITPVNVYNMGTGTLIASANVTNAKLPNIELFFPDDFVRVLDTEVVGDCVYILTYSIKIKTVRLFKYDLQDTVVVEKYNFNLSDSLLNVSNVEIGQSDYDLFFSININKLLIIPTFHGGFLYLFNVDDLIIDKCVEFTFNYMKRYQYGGESYGGFYYDNNIAIETALGDFSFKNAVEFNGIIYGKKGCIDCKKLIKSNNGSYFEMTYPYEYGYYFNYGDVELVTAEGDIGESSSIALYNGSLYKRSQNSNVVQVLSNELEKDVIDISGVVIDGGTLKIHVDPDYLNMGFGASIIDNAPLSYLLTKDYTIYNGGSGYLVGDKVTIHHSTIVFEVTSVDSNGSITALTPSPSIYNINENYSYTDPIGISNISSYGHLVNLNCIEVPVLTGDSSSVVATKIYNALNLDTEYKLNRDYDRILATVNANVVTASYLYAQPTLKMAVELNGVTGLRIRTAKNINSGPQFGNIFKVGLDLESPFNKISTAIDEVESILSVGDTALLLVDNKVYVDDYIRSSSKINIIIKAINCGYKSSSQEDNDYIDIIDSDMSYAAVLHLTSNFNNGYTAPIVLNETQTHSRDTFLILEGINLKSDVDSLYSKAIHYIPNDDNTTYLVANNCNMSIYDNNMPIHRECSGGGDTFYLNTSSSCAFGYFNHIETDSVPTALDKTTIDIRGPNEKTTFGKVKYFYNGTYYDYINQTGNLGQDNGHYIVNVLDDTSGTVKSDPLWITEDGKYTPWMPPRVKKLIETGTIGSDW